MTTLLIIIHVIVCFFLIAIVLLQHGKGADAGATFGGGSSQTLFGSEGPLPLLNKITTFSAIVFMGTSVTLAYLSAHKSSGSIMSKLPAKEAAAPVNKEAPVTIPMPTEQPAGKIEAKPVVPAPAQTAPAEPAQKAAEPTAPKQEQAAPSAEKPAAAAPVVEQKPAQAAEQQQTQAQAAAPAASEQKKQDTTAPAQKKPE